MARIYKQKTKTKGFSYYFTIELGKDNTGKRNRIKRGGFTRRKDAEKAALELEAAALSGKVIKQNTSITLHYFMCVQGLKEDTICKAKILPEQLQ